MAGINLCAALAAGAALSSLVAVRAGAEETPPAPLQQAIGDPDGFDLSGSVRARVEVLGNQFRPGLARDDGVLVLRTLLRGDLDAGPVDVVAELEDSRAYGANARSSIGTGDVDALELLQAYVRVPLAGSRRKPSAALDLGRFTMDLGSRRLVARNGFRNTINGFTGARLALDGPAQAKLTAFYTLPQVRLPLDGEAIRANRVRWDRESFDLQFWGTGIDLPLSPGDPVLSLAYLGLAENDRADLATRDRHLATFDARLFAKPAPGRFDYEVEAALQTGSISASTSPVAPRVPVRAGMAHVAAGYQFASAWKPRVSLVFDWASGDGSGRRYDRFDTLFGARRADFGPTGIYGLLGRANLLSPGLFLEASPGKRLSLMAAGRLAWLDSATDSFASSGVRDASGGAGRFGGGQVEARARYWLVPGRLQLEGGAAYFARGRFLRDAPGAQPGDPLYGYVQLEATL